ncbi:hypothetical protein B0H11DRAFT_2351170 [Mycena galericulata]|nr:hypothetical protein B0H11DRAFT_2351170 [Mycena galericulata]
MDPHTNLEDDEDVSQYNDGRGLQFTVEFTGLIPRPAHGKKTRKNAKRLVLKKTIYVHEDSELNNLLNTFFRALDRHEGDDALTFSWLPRTGAYSSPTIDIPNMTYSIPKTPFKDMSLTCEKDYETLIGEVKKLKKPDPDLVKICMAELKHPGGEDDDDESSDDEQPRRKKGKTYEPSAEEVEQTEFIVKLQARWKCNDRRCKRFLCFPDKTTAKHVHLTHLHLQSWAAAAQAKHVNADGSTVDVDNPPDHKLFEFQETENEEDQQLLRTRATQKATAKDSNITINLTLPDPALPLQPHQQQRINAPAPLPRRIPPQISLEIFVDRYNLTNAVYQKLADFSVTGPHTLRHLKNEHLLEAGLNHAEVANVHDAQDRWVAGEGEL